MCMLFVWHFVTYPYKGVVTESHKFNLQSIVNIGGSDPFITSFERSTTFSDLSTTQTLFQIGLHAVKYYINCWKTTYECSYQVLIVYLEQRYISVW